MPIVSAAEAPEFKLPGVRFVGLAAPSRGSRETSAWRIELAPGTPGTPHRVTREEIFIAISGSAVAVLENQERELAAGSALIVPPNVEFSLANPGKEPFRAIAIMPVGGQALVGDEPPFAPPWTL
jgi:mannose-6-phosphate isomerase-like protein (cupin superfamily)